MFIVYMFCFLSGTDIETNHKKFLEWLHRVYREMGLPCCGETTGIGGKKIMGCFQMMKAGEVDKFIQELQWRMMDWGGRCIDQQRSAGAVVKSAPAGRGLLTFTTIQVGPFRD